MKLTILGSGTAIPSPERGPPGMLLEAGEKNLLIDCGPGNLRAAAAAGVGPCEIDGVLLTHFHVDHTTDLRSLLFALRSPSYAGRPPLSVTGPAGLSRLLDQWFAADDGQWLRPEGYELIVREIGEGEHVLEGLSVTAIHVDHTPVSLAYRIRETEDGAVLAISGDTAVCDGIVHTGLHADLFVLECAVPDAEPFGLHLTPTKAAEVAAAANPKKLVLTHFYPGVLCEPIEEVVSRRYSGEIRMAYDGAEYEIA